VVPVRSAAMRAVASARSPTRSAFRSPASTSSVCVRLRRPKPGRRSPSHHGRATAALRQPRDVGLAAIRPGSVARERPSVPATQEAGRPSGSIQADAWDERMPRGVWHEPCSLLGSCSPSKTLSACARSKRLTNGGPHSVRPRGAASSRAARRTGGGARRSDARSRAHTS
jgi:hypothetical protein